MKKKINLLIIIIIILLSCCMVNVSQAMDVTVKVPKFSFDKDLGTQVDEVYIGLSKKFEGEKWELFVQKKIKAKIFLDLKSRKKVPVEAFDSLVNSHFYEENYTSVERSKLVSKIQKRCSEYVFRKKCVDEPHGLQYLCLKALINKKKKSIEAVPSKYRSKNVLEKIEKIIHGGGSYKGELEDLHVNRVDNNKQTCDILASKIWIEPIFPAEWNNQLRILLYCVQQTMGNRALLHILGKSKLPIQQVCNFVTRSKIIGISSEDLIKRVDFLGGYLRLDRFIEIPLKNILYDNLVEKEFEAQTTRYRLKIPKCSVKILKKEYLMRGFHDLFEESSIEDFKNIPKCDRENLIDYCIQGVAYKLSKGDPKAYASFSENQKKLILDIILLNEILHYPDWAEEQKKFLANYSLADIDSLPNFTEYRKNAAVHAFINSLFPEGHLEKEFVLNRDVPKFINNMLRLEKFTSGRIGVAATYWRREYCFLNTVLPFREFAQHGYSFYPKLPLDQFFGILDNRDYLLRASEYPSYIADIGYDTFFEITGESNLMEPLHDFLTGLSLKEFNLFNDCLNEASSLEVNSSFLKMVIDICRKCVQSEEWHGLDLEQKKFVIDALFFCGLLDLDIESGSQDRCLYWPHTSINSIYTFSDIATLPKFEEYMTDPNVYGCIQTMIPGLISHLTSKPLKQRVYLSSKAPTKIMRLAVLATVPYMAWNRGWRPW